MFCRSWVERSIDSSDEQPENMPSVAHALDVSSPDRSMDVMAEQPANSPRTLPSVLTPGSMTAEVILAACALQGEISVQGAVPSISPSVPLSPLVGRMVSLPEPSMTHEHVPLVPRAMSAACAVSGASWVGTAMAVTGINAVMRAMEAKAAMILRTVVMMWLVGIAEPPHGAVVREEILYARFARHAGAIARPCASARWRDIALSYGPCNLRHHKNTSARAPSWRACSS